MKLRINRQEAVDALAGICVVAAVRSPKDSLKCVRLEAQSDVLFLSATDLELSLRCAVAQVEVDEPGDLLVVAETLSKIVRECDDEILDLQTDASTLHIRGSGSHFQIVTQGETDFPPIPLLDGEADVAVEYGTLLRLVDLTSFAAARESTRYAINGVLWELSEKRLTLAATDGRRLAVAHGDLLEGGAKAGGRAIIPTKTLTLLQRLPVDSDVRVGIRLSDNQLLLDLGRAMVSSALVEGQFPKYQDVVPADCDRDVTLKVAELHSALKRAALLTNEESKGVRLSFADGTLTLSSRAPEQGEATIAMPVEYGHDALEIGFNPVFLLDVLRVLNADELILSLKASDRPGLIRLGDDFVYVVMPVNLTSA